MSDTAGRALNKRLKRLDECKRQLRQLDSQSKSFGKKKRELARVLAVEKELLEDPGALKRREMEKQSSKLEAMAKSTSEELTHLQSGHLEAMVGAVAHRLSLVSPHTASGEITGKDERLQTVLDCVGSAIQRAIGVHVVELEAAADSGNAAVHSLQQQQLKATELAALEEELQELGAKAEEGEEWEIDVVNAARQETVQKRVETIRTQIGGLGGTEDSALLAWLVDSTRELEAKVERCQQQQREMVRSSTKWATR